MSTEDVTFITTNIAIKICNEHKRLAILRVEILKRIEILEPSKAYITSFALLSLWSHCQFNVSTTNQIATEVNYYTPKLAERNVAQYASRYEYLRQDINLLQLGPFHLKKYYQISASAIDNTIYI